MIWFVSYLQTQSPQKLWNRDPKSLHNKMENIKTTQNLILDTKEKKLIEVKMTINPQRIIEFFEEDRYTDENNSLIVINIQTNNITMLNKEEMPGTSKALNFLLKKSALMETSDLIARKDLI